MLEEPSPVRLVILKEYLSTVKDIRKNYCTNVNGRLLNKGCSEFASDCELINETSRLFHINSGFKEVNRVICFTKKL